MRNPIFWTSLFLISSFFACQDPLPDPCPNGTGEVKDTTITFDFTAGVPKHYLIRPNIDLLVEKQNSPQVTFSTQSSVLSRMALLYEDDTLRWDFNKCVRRYRQVQATLEIPEAQTFTLRDSSILRINKPFADEMLVRLNDEATIDFTTPFTELIIESTSIGNSVLRDSLNGLIVNMSDGVLNAEDAWVKNAIINVSGEAEVRLGVYRSLNVKASGSAKVYYRGDPTLNVDLLDDAQIFKLP